ncbi:mucin-5AC-like [Silurus meridionalis]|uniref:mucin-5AC-like n=1 Tax=Silurus meridionalis TaxID=175797 RepID=UPI001EECF1C3|nr:mucin-5AC-like [Silurus meridionalis]
MWQANFFIIMYATLGSFYLGITTKANIAFVKSSSDGYFGKLIFESDSKLISHKNKESDNTNPQAVLEDTKGYQSDEPASTAWHEMESKLMQLNPTVYCGGDAMTLNVQGSIMANFMIDGDDGPVPVMQIPANCGISVTQSSTEAFLTVPYHGCYVTQQENGHVLPLRLGETPMKISCHMPPYDPPIVFCFASGMVAKIGCRSADVLKIKVNGKWDPFIPASSKCGITTEYETDGVVVTAPHQSSCWQIKGGKKFLSIQYGNEEFALSCLDSQNPHPYVVSSTIVPYHSYEPNITPPTDNITTINIATAPGGLARKLKQPMLYPFGKMYYRHSWANPSRNLLAGTSTVSSITSSPTPTPASTSKPIDMMYPFPLISYQFFPMSYSKPVPDGYPWTFPSKSPTVTPTGAQTAKTPTTSQTTASTIMSRKPQPSAYPFSQIYYPIGVMLYHPRFMPYGYPWAPLEVPTTATTTTSKTATSSQTTTKSNILASNPKSYAYPFKHNYHPFGLIHNYHKPMPHGFPAKALTTVPTKTAPTTVAATTATTPSIVDSNPQQSAYFFNKMYSPFGLMLNRRKPIPYAYPWVFPAKTPTTTPMANSPTTTTATTLQTTTTSTVVSSNSQQPVNSFSQLYYVFGPMPYNRKPMTHRHHLAFPAKVSTIVLTKTAPKIETAAKTATTSKTNATTLSSDNNDLQQPLDSFNQLYYKFGPMHCYQRPSHFLGDPLAFPAKASNTAPNQPTPTPKTALSVVSKTSPGISPIAMSSHPKQSADPLNQIHHQFGPVSYYSKPNPYGYPLVFPAKIPKNAPRSETSTTVATYPQQSMYSQFNSMRYQYKPAHHLGYPWALTENALTTTLTVPTASATTTTSPQMYYPFVPIHFTKHLAPWMYYYKHNQLQKGPKHVYTTSPSPGAIKHSK